MDRAVAERMIQLVLALDGPVSEALELAEKIADETERKAVRRALGELTLQAYADLIRPIVRQFPDLEPDKSHGGP